MIKLSQLKLYGATTRPEDDALANIGGAIDLTCSPTGSNVTGLLQIVSSVNADQGLGQTVTLTYLTAGNLLTEVKTLNGLTPVPFFATIWRILKAVKNISTAGVVAVEHQTPTRIGTAQGGSTDEFQVLDSGASDVDGTYVGEVLRVTGGTGAYQIRQILRYDGATRQAWVSHLFGVVPDATTTFRIAPGLVFEKAPHEIMTCTQLFYGAESAPSDGAERVYYDKCFWKNTSDETGTLAEIAEGPDPSGRFTFAVALAKDDALGNGAGNNRSVAPAGIVFNNAPKPVPGNQLVPNEAIGVWYCLTLLPGLTAEATTIGTECNVSTLV